MPRTSAAAARVGAERGIDRRPNSVALTCWSAPMAITISRRIGLIAYTYARTHAHTATAADVVRRISVAAPAAPGAGLRQSERCHDTSAAGRRMSGAASGKRKNIAFARPLRFVCMCFPYIFEVGSIQFEIAHVACEGKGHARARAAHTACMMCS